MKSLLKILCALMFLPAVALADKKDTPTVFVSAILSVDTSAYATGDLIGAKQTYNYATQVGTGSGYVTSVTISDQSVQASDLDLFLFCTNPAATTFTDQAALDVADADTTKVCGVVHFDSTTRFAFADNGVKFIIPNPIPIRTIDTYGEVTRTLYGALVSRGTPTFAASTDLKVTIAILQE